MKLKTLYLLISSLTFTLFGCEDKPNKNSNITDDIIIKVSPEDNKSINDLLKLNLKGNVKTLKEVSYHATLENGKLIKGLNGRKIPWENNFQSIFNLQGNIVEKIEYNLDDSYNSKIEYKYNLNNTLKEDLSHNSYLNSKTKSSYKYDKNGRLIEYIFPSDKTLHERWIYKYDNTGNEIEINFIDQKNWMYQKFTSKYDEKGQKIEHIGKYYFNPSIDEKILFEYDENGNKTVISKYNSNGKFVEKIICEYDENKNIIKEIVSTTTQNSTTTYEYEYDIKGNFIKKIEYINNEPNFIIIREIEYYN